MDINLTAWEVRIIRLGIFLIFLVTFGDYVVKKIWPVIGQLFHH